MMLLELGGVYTGTYNSVLLGLQGN